MLSEVCRYLNNWFDCERLFGEFTISDGTIAVPELQDGQYFRIDGSVFNDGIYKYPTSELTDETFDGAVWALAIPKEVEDLSAEIDAWKTRYLSADSAALSPYMSESFGGYSVTKGSTSTGQIAGGDWTQVSGFTSRLNTWRKPRCRY